MPPMSQDPMVTDEALRAIEGLARDISLRPTGTRDMAMARLVVIVQPLTLASIIAELRRWRAGDPASARHRRPAPSSTIHPRPRPSLSPGPAPKSGSDSRSGSASRPESEPGPA